MSYNLIRETAIYLEGGDYTVVNRAYLFAHDERTIEEEVTQAYLHFNATTEIPDYVKRYCDNILAHKMPEEDIS